MPIIGGHVSIAGGFDKSIDRAVAIGANTLQTFASSPRSLSTTQFPEEVLDLYQQKKSAAGMESHFFHGVYLINLAHEKPDYVLASIESLNFYQALAGKIHGAGTIFHLGSHKGAGFAKVKKQITHAIEEVLIKTPDGVALYLENAAGQSGAIGADLSELRQLYDGITSPELRSKLRVCYDTQHGFSAGLDIRSHKAMTATAAHIDNRLGIDLIGVIHANDSMVELGGQRDRHENIGRGKIGAAGFTAFVHHPAFRDLPYILEVPGTDKSGPQAADITALAALFV